MAAFLSQDAAHGALPTLRAATERHAASASYFAPHRMLQLTGDPVRVPLPKPALEQAAARRLWEISEKLTGVAWRVGEPAHALARD